MSSLARAWGQSLVILYNGDSGYYRERLQSESDILYKYNIKTPKTKILHHTWHWVYNYFPDMSPGSQWEDRSWWLLTAMFVLLFSFTALVFTMCLVTVSDIGIVTVWCNLFLYLMFIQTGCVKRVEMSMLFKTLLHLISKYSIKVKWSLNWKPNEWRTWRCVCKMSIND